MNHTFLRRHWYADIYEKQVIQAEEVNLILSIVGNEPKRILEIACGGGRITIPLAQAGHDVTGFDFDEYMLEKILPKANSLPNLHFYQADAVTADWGKDYDIIILAGNILLNIESDLPYERAQELFIQKASDCIKQDGYLYLDFDCYERPEQSCDNKREWVCFEGIDDLGTYGKYIIISSDYSNTTHIDRSSRRFEITPRGSAMFTYETNVVKHFPTFHQVKEWLDRYGLEIITLYGDYNQNPMNDKTTRAIIWARKR